MKEIQILDCTLRDGGRVIDCAFRDEQTTGLIKRLMQAQIDIIEVGFLRNVMDFHGNSTFFGTIEQVEQILPPNTGQQFALFIDHGMYDIEKLTPCKQEFCLGIRYGFTRTNFQQSLDTIKREMLQIKEKGYRLYFQGVNTVGYADKELLDLIALANEVVPYSFGIVDTYGSMYSEDLERLLPLVEFNLNSNIAIAFHGHNNMQMAFALAQDVIRLCRGRRNLVIDATLDGMGKCAGNLNTELITNYLNQKCGKGYDLDCLLDTIDEYIDVFKHKEIWGYSIPSFMAGIYRAHPNNIIYLTRKFRLSTKDIRKILSLIEEPIRQRYDYDNIQNIYKSYFAAPFDDENSVQRLASQIQGKPVLVVAPGQSVREHASDIEHYIQNKHPIVISVNFVHEKCQYAFFGNDRRYQNLCSTSHENKILLTSNVKQRTGQEIVFNYINCIADSGNYFDNSTLMLLNLLQRLGTEKIRIAGMDGFIRGKANYFNDSDLDKKCAEQFEEINRELEKQLHRFAERNRSCIDIQFITPSLFENAIEKESG